MSSLKELSIEKSKEPDSQNDITDPLLMSLLALLENLHASGISRPNHFLTATGIHDPHTHEQNVEVYGKNLADEYKFVSHCADDVSSCSSLANFLRV